MFTETHDAFWQRARTAHGDGDGTRALIDVLLHRRHTPGDVAAGLRAALRVGCIDPAVVAIEARRHADGHGDGPAAARRRLATIIELPDRAVLGASRAAPTLTGYDQLLTRTQPAGQPAITQEESA